MNTTRYEH
ncbi:hypothetical protein CISIN_1g0455452mg, partial [Citrus sinensis]